MSEPTRQEPPRPRAGARPAADDDPPPRVCELCGGTAYERHCKILCLNCGYQRDCSDP